MSRKLNLVGNRYSRLTVFEYSGKRHPCTHVWKCKCDCGNIVEATTNHLRAGNTKSCGCLNTETRISLCKSRQKHGHAKRKSQSIEYHSWTAMIQRCTNENHPDFIHYGGRGISVCERWMDFKCFFEDMGKRPLKTSIDRIDVNSGYFKENCRWASHSVQMQNTRITKRISVFGETLTLREASSKFNIPFYRLKSRINILKMNPELACTLPIMDKSKNFKGKQYSAKGSES